MQYIPYKMRQGPPQNGPCREKSQNDADQAAAAVVDDPLQSLPQLAVGVAQAFVLRRQRRCSAMTSLAISAALPVKFQ